MPQVIQSAANLVFAGKKQSGIGVAASGSGGFGMRIRKGTTGLKLEKSIITSNELRGDGQTRRGRHGSRRVPGMYGGELSVGGWDDMFAAAMRASAWTAAFQITQAAMTSITTTTNTIVAAGGSWLTQGVRRGMKVKLGSHATAGNNGKWLRVLGVTATTITVPANSLTADAVADTNFTLDVAKHLIIPAAPVESYFTFDQHYQDADQSLLFTDCKVHGFKIAAKPDAHIEVDFPVTGLDGDDQATGASPVLTTPTYGSARPLVMADGTIRINGTDYNIITDLSAELVVAAQVPGVLAPNAPDVSLSNGLGRGQFTALVPNLDFFELFDAETPVDLFFDMVENESDPKDFFSIYAGDAVLDGWDAPPSGDGPLPATVPFSFGKDEGGSDRAASMLLLSTSVA